jgi:hypothetical protein
MDVDLRRNMASTGWKDVGAMIASRDIIIITEAGETVEPELVTAAIQECGAGGSVRFAVVVSQDQRLSLQLQRLPATANMLKLSEGKKYILHSERFTINRQV